MRLKSLCNTPMHTTTVSGELTFNIFLSLSQFQRKLIQECIKEGLSIAKARGKLGG